MNYLWNILLLPLVSLGQGINMTNIPHATNVNANIDSVLGLSDTYHTRMFDGLSLAKLAVGYNYSTASQFGALGNGHFDEAALQDGINWSALNGGVFVFDLPVTVSTNMVGTTNDVSGTYQYSDLALPSGATILCLPGVTITRDTNNTVLLGNTTPQLVPFYAVPPESNITVIGGNWNCNGTNNTVYEWDATNNAGCYGMSFMGVSNLVMQGVTLRNSASFGILLGNAVDCRIDDYTAVQDAYHDWSTYVEDHGNDGLHMYDPIERLKVRNMTTFNLNDNPLAFCPGEQRNATNVWAGYTIKPWGASRFETTNNFKGIKDVVVDGLHQNHSRIGLGLWGYPTFGITTVSGLVIRNVDGDAYTSGLQGGGDGTSKAGGGCYYSSITIEHYRMKGGGSRISLLDDPANSGTIVLNDVSINQLPYEFVPSTIPWIQLCASNVIINGMVLTAISNTFDYAISTHWSNAVSSSLITAPNVSVNESHLNGFTYLIGNSTNMTRLNVSGLNGALPLTNSTSVTYSGDAFPPTPPTTTNGLFSGMIWSSNHVIRVYPF